MADFFKDIIDLSSVHSLIESLQQATGIPVNLLDHEGEMLVSAGWQDACAIFHRQHLKTNERCRESDFFFSRFLNSNELPPQGYIQHTCKNGMIELGLPIVIDDFHFATLLFGQFLPDPIDLDFYREIAADCGIEEKPYLDAIASVPAFDQTIVNKLVAVYAGVVELLIRLGETHIEEARTREELEKSEIQFRDLFNNASDAVYIISTDGQILEVNNVACDRQGYTRKELCAMHISELNDPKFSAGVKDRLNRFKRGEKYIFETAHLHQNGESIPVEISGRTIDFDGKRAIMATARDLRERQDAFQALQRSEVRFRSIVDSSPMGIHLYYLDPEDRLIFTGANPAADQILGIDNRQFIGKTIEEAFPNLQETEIPETYRDVCRNDQTWHSEQIVYEDNNVSGAFEIYAFRTAQRTMATYFLDITERKKGEQALRESEEKYRLLFSAEMDAILIFDSTNLTVVEANAAALKMYGYSQDEFDQLRAIDLSAEPELSQERIKAAIEGRLNLMESQHKKKDGSVFPVEITAGTFEWQNKFMLVAIIRDISERDRITRMKDEMLSAISHEMRTPLTAILGFNELLLQEDLDPEKTRQFLQLSYQEGERLRELIDDLLDLQRLRAGFIGAQFSSIQIKPVLHEIANIFIEMDTGHAITVSCPDNLPDIIADEQKINRALKNLLANAVKYSPGGGPITLSVKFIKAKKIISIAVSDKGLGIPKEAHSELFDRFYRVYHPEIQNIGGTGLGLALVKEIAKIHEGKVRVKSTPGKGSTFYLDLLIAGPKQPV